MYALRRIIPRGIRIKPLVRQANGIMTEVKRAKLNDDAKGHDRIVWVDCEMTGLDVDNDHIIEIACLVTDGKLNIVAKGPNLIIHQPDHIMDNMNDWCKEHHGKSGLTQAVKDSQISLQQAEKEVLAFVQDHTPAGSCPLAGNSIHADKKFLDKYMPDFMGHLHYRIIDVSTIKELCRRWYPTDLKKAPPKARTHRAMDDIRESIKELQYYQTALFKPPES
ncbi:oligoribonuclease, mitochondrial [Lingula anatina]|uniref:Oligoribonuclease, mitochondrial n=1 Tax=Lingula anatina TaxID=7574 RepID=A0A1S3HGA9_LINAN|nr:oligoribonuclease, mitochondrial [Lingula anatina]|eukprot:XP_013384064.1 oligoribonuclease, mitochondrial [Lingula anatina]